MFQIFFTNYVPKSRFLPKISIGKWKKTFLITQIGTKKITDFAGSLEFLGYAHGPNPFKFTMTDLEIAQ